MLFRRLPRLNGRLLKKSYFQASYFSLRRDFRCSTDTQPIAEFMPQRLHIEQIYRRHATDVSKDHECHPHKSRQTRFPQSTCK